LMNVFRQARLTDEFDEELRMDLATSPL
jgi:hypothetical protein